MDFSNALSLSIPEGEVTKITSGSTVLWNKPTEKTATGSYISLNDSINVKIKGFKLYGKSTQNGTPTPTAPIEIESVVNPTITSSGLKSGEVSHVQIPEKRATQNLVPMSTDSSGAVFNGTGYQLNSRLNSSGNVVTQSQAIASGFIPYTPKVGDIIQCRIPNAAALTAAGNYFSAYSSTYTKVISVLMYTMSNQTYDATTGVVTITVDQTFLNSLGGVAYFRCSRSSTTAVTDETAKDFEIKIIKTLELHSVPSAKDEYSSHGKFIQRILTKTFTGTESWALNVNATNWNRFTLTDKSVVDCTNSDTEVRVMSDKLKAVSAYDDINVASFATTNAYQISVISNNRVSITMPQDIKYPDSFKAWLKNNPVTVQYELKSPIETDLSAEEVQDLLLLQTFSPATVVSNDKGAEMEVTYLSRG